MHATEALKSIDTLARVVLESDDKEAMRKHLEMIREVVAKTGQSRR